MDPDLLIGGDLALALVLWFWCVVNPRLAERRERLRQFKVECGERSAAELEARCRAYLDAGRDPLAVLTWAQHTMRANTLDPVVAKTIRDHVSEWDFVKELEAR